MNPDREIENQDKERRYYGKYRAFVRDVADHEKRFRLRAYCPAVMGPTDDTNHWLDWADPCFAAGGLGDYGDAVMPPYNAGVWVEFEMGDPMHPIWVGCWYAGKDPQSSEAPALAKGDGDETTGAPKGADKALTKTIDEDTGEAVDSEVYQENLSPYATVYPKNRVIKTASGHVIELDDTEGQERIHIYHRAGTYTEINAEGAVTSKAMSSLHEIVKGDHVTHDNKNRILVVDGAVGETVGGLVSQVYMDGLRRLVQKEVKEWFKNTVEQKFDSDLLQNIGGSHKRLIAGNHTKSVVGNANDFISGSYDLTSLEKMSITLGNSHPSGLDAYLLAAITGNISFRAVAGNIILESIMPGGISLGGGPAGIGALDFLVKGTTYRLAEVTMHTAVIAAWLALFTEMTASGVGLSTVGASLATAGADPVFAALCSTAAGAVAAAGVAATAVGVADTACAPAMQTAQTAVTTFEGGAATYLSLISKTV